MKGFQCETRHQGSMLGKDSSFVYRLLVEHGNNRLLEADLNIEQRLELAMRGTAEIIQRSELEKLLEEKKNPRAYWGFECSGKRAHPARNDARRPRARLRLQDPRPNPIRLPFHSLPRRLALDDQQQIRRRPREDQNSRPILQALFHSPRSPREQGGVYLGLRTC